jgi:uncharacterized protein YjbI with pentapeptide repeats
MKSSRVFNRIREQYASEPTSFLNVKLHSEDLSSYNLSHARFTTCEFHGVKFGPIEKSDFADCTFHFCTFSEAGSEAAPSLKNVTFYVSNFEATNLSNCFLNDVSLAKSRFLSPPKFEGSKAKGVIRIEKCGDGQVFKHLPDLILQEDWQSSLKTDISVDVSWWPSWGHVRALQQIPFLQTSLVGLLLLVTQISFLEFLVAILGGPAGACEALRTRVASELSKTGSNEVLATLHLNLANWCSTLSPSKVISVALTSIGQSVIMFVLLFAATLIHKARCPSEIAEYSFNQWTIDRAKPAVYYQLLAWRNPYSLIIAIMFYFLALMIFCYLFLYRMYFVFNAA